MFTICNDSHSDFILLGFSDKPYLEKILFWVVLIFYCLTIIGNLVIILVSLKDPKLHIPMYYFLSNLSLLDLCFTSSCVPQMLVNFGGPEKTISYIGCAIQLYVFLWLGATECVLLVVMAVDRYVAVCHPLQYTTIIMNSRLCQQLAAVAWVTGFSNSLVQTVLTFLLPRCGQYQVENFFCEVPAMLQLSCVDTWINEVEMYAAVVVIKVIPVGLILFSYINIVRAVVRIQSSEGRKKAFNTCGSHLLVVIMFYGSAISGYAYMAPKSNSAKLKGKNKDVKGAVKKLLGREQEQEWNMA
uniref:Olfactory receptor n=1 Tax=Sus scrofa TaxID=9823 RepID=A0A287BDN9_PIG